MPSKLDTLSKSVMNVKELKASLSNQVVLGQRVELIRRTAKLERVEFCFYQYEIYLTILLFPEHNFVLARNNPGMSRKGYCFDLK